MPSGHPVTAALTLIAVLAVTSCNDDGRELDPPTFPLPATTLPAVEPTLAAESTAPLPLRLIAPWPDGAAIPTRHTCDGEGLAPALSWTGVPSGTVELAVTVTDLDGGPATLWILEALDPTRVSIIEGRLPEEGIERVNTSGETSWQAPCPPAGETRRYQFTVHALNQQLEVADDAATDEVISLLNVIAIDQASVTGTAARTE